MVAKVLAGSKDRMIFQFGLHRLSTYGILRECAQAQILAWVKELISRGCVAARRTTMSGRIYAVVELTGLGSRVMKGDETILLSRPERPLPRLEPVPDRDNQPDPAVFDKLRDLRLALAKKENLPAYCIFQDRTLREMAAVLPRNRDELLGIVGVGEVTLKKYGDAFLQAIAEMSDRERTASHVI
jgi:ATP-dependent DNA helicase RecQ